MSRSTTLAVSALLVGGIVSGSTAMATGTALAAPGRPIGGPGADHSGSATPARDRARQEERARQAEVVQAWVRLWNGDYAQAERIVSPEVRVRAALMDGGDGSAIKGPGGMAAMVRQIRSISPDLRFSIEVGPIIDDDQVVLRWIATGTYGGGFPGATAEPGTPLRFTGTDTLRLERGRIVDYWLNADTLLLTTQLEVNA